MMRRSIAVIQPECYAWRQLHAHFIVRLSTGVSPVPANHFHSVFLAQLSTAKLVPRGSSSGVDTSHWLTHDPELVGHWMWPAGDGALSSQQRRSGLVFMSELKED